MSRQRSCAAALAALLALSWHDGLALDRLHGEFAETSVSGAPPGYASSSIEAPVVPPALDDMLQPIGDSTPPPLPLPDQSDVAVTPAQNAERTTLWQHLAKIAPERRSDASIEVELGAGAGSADQRAAALVAALWNGGHHSSALEALRSLEERGVAAAVGLAWKAGTGPEVLRQGTDRRIGGTLTDCQNAALDFDAQNGNLFSVVRWGSTTGDSDWTLNISTNGGTTWTETYDWFSTIGMTDVSAAVVSEYVYVAYLYPGAAGEVRVRRCGVSNGAVDAVYGFRIILTTTTTVSEVVVASNAEDFDNRIYVLSLQSDHVMRFAWDLATDGTTFTDGGSPAVANASFGLDASWNHNHTCTPFLFASYVGTDAYVHVQTYSDPTWTDRLVSNAAGTVRPTSISSYGNNVICAFENLNVETHTIKYMISYDCGETWASGTHFPGAGVTAYYAPDVDARDGHGTALVYEAEMGEPDQVLYRVRAGYAPGLWSEEAPFNDLDVVTGSETVIAHVGTLGANAFSHGAIYCAPSDIPYFDLPGLGVVGAPVIAETSSAFALSAAEPNPAKDHAVIRFTLPTAGRARLQLFDVAGRHVATLFDAPALAGPHAVSVDASALASGVYFYRLTSAKGSEEKRLVVIR